MNDTTVSIKPATSPNNPTPNDKLWSKNALALVTSIEIKPDPPLINFDKIDTNLNNVKPDPNLKIKQNAESHKSSDQDPGKQEKDIKETKESRFVDKCQ